MVKKMWNKTDPAPKGKLILIAYKEYPNGKYKNPFADVLQLNSHVIDINSAIGCIAPDGWGNVSSNDPLKFYIGGLTHSDEYYNVGVDPKDIIAWQPLPTAPAE